MRWRRLSAVVAICTVAWCGLVHAELPGWGGLAVLPMTGDSKDGSLAKGLAELLARDRSLRVLPPEAMPVVEPGEVEARRIRQLARDAQVDAIVTGKVASDSGKRTIEIAVRSGHSGALISEYRVALPPGQGEGAPLLELAGAILESLGYDRLPLPGVAAGEPETRGRPAQDGTLKVLRPDEPVSIRSNELEVTQRDDKGRHLVFVGEVRVVQGDMVLEAERLEAFYPEGSSRPRQLEATGSVRVTQGGKQARCEEATYDSAEHRISCRGRAELAQGCETVRGREIEFDLARERVRVVGAASVVLQSDGEASDCEGAAS